MTSPSFPELEPSGRASAGPNPNPMQQTLLLGRAAGYERAADRLRAIAGEVPDAFRREIAGHAGRDVWVGPAATRFEDEFTGHARRLDEFAASLTGLAAALDREAARLRADARPLGVFGATG